MRIKTLFLVVCAVIFFTASISFASLNHLPLTYGLSARSIGMANTSTALTEDLGGAYFNPAAMALTTESKVGLTYILGVPQFRGGQKNGTKDTFSESNQIVSTGMIFSMDELLKSNRKMALGVNFTLDGNGLTFIRFNDLRHENGYYARYGEASFMINAAFGLEVVEWLYLGGGILTTLHSSADFYTDIDLAGRTDKEGMSLNAKAVFSPVAAIFFSVDPVAIGLVYRGESHGEMVPITTNATNSVGGSKLVDLPIELLFKDAFVPANLSLGVSWDITESVMLAIDGIWYHWGEYDEIMTVNDLVRDEMNTDFVDTYVPKLGLEYQVIDRLFLRFGYSYEASPLRKAGDKGNYILDNDKHVGSLGIGYDLNIGLFNYPFSIDAAFFHHYLAPRELEGADGVKLESEGNLSGGTASITLRF